MTDSTSEAPLTTGDYQALARFRHALRTFLSFSEQSARTAGLTPAQHQLLLAVKGFPGDDDPPLTTVADMLKLKVHSVGELVDRAEVNGLVSRLVDPADRRRVLVQITPQGDDRLANLAMVHRRELRRFRQEMNDILHELEG